VIGVTGKYCAGKDTAVRFLVESGYVEINVDRVGHDALRSERERIIGHFGDEVRGPSGEIDRSALGRIAFGSPLRLRELESIVHPVMVEEVRSRIDAARQQGAPPAGLVINAAILFRMGLDRLCDVVVYVHAPLLIRYRRARARDGVTLRRFIHRLRSQRDVSPQFSSPDADVLTVKNSGDEERLRAKLEALLVRS
jgi:dephospho-CoA kinase